MPAPGWHQGCSSDQPEAGAAIDSRGQAPAPHCHGLVGRQAQNTRKQTSDSGKSVKKTKLGTVRVSAGWGEVEALTREAIGTERPAAENEPDTGRFS